MSRFAWASWIVVLGAVAASGCGRKGATPPAPADAAPATPPFIPEEARALEIPELTLALEAPGNLAYELADGALRLSAPGFPDVTILVEKTTAASGVGGGGACDDDGCRYVYAAPCREITCEAVSPGPFVSVIPAICGSLRSTYRPPTTPRVRALSTSGMTVNCEPDQVERAQGLDPKIAALAPRIDACWKERAADNATWVSGELNVRLERTVTDEGRATYGLKVILSGLEADTTALEECLDAVVAPLRAALPAVTDADCAFGYDHTFALAREASCPGDGPGGGEGDGGGGEGDGDHDRDHDRDRGEGAGG